MEGKRLTASGLVYLFGGGFVKPAGRFRPEKVHWSAQGEAIARLAGEVETLKASLEVFAGVDPDLHKRLVGEVGVGISAQQMEVDVDYDFD